MANVPEFHLKVIICCAVISTTGFLWFVRRFGRKFLFPRVLPQLHYVHFLSCSKLKSPLKSSPIGSCTERNRDKHDYNLQHGNMMVRELSSFGNSFFFFLYLFICLSFFIFVFWNLLYNTFISSKYVLSYLFHRDKWLY